LRHKISLIQPSANVDIVAKSTFQALRAYYAATKSDKDAYEVCKDIISPMLDKMVSTPESRKIVNFMGMGARKAGLLSESMKWNDLGLRKCANQDKSTNALFLLRNAALLFRLPQEDLGMLVLVGD
jgi:hypothetical protein